MHFQDYIFPKGNENKLLFDLSHTIWFLFRIKNLQDEKIKQKGKRNFIVSFD